MLADDVFRADDVVPVFRNPTSPRYKVEKLEGATKYRIGGWLTCRALDKILNGVCVKQPFPFQAVRQWRNALLRANKQLLDDWQVSLRDRLQSLVGDLGQAGHSLLNNHYETWLLAVAEAHITHLELAEPASLLANPASGPKKKRRHKGKSAPENQGATQNALESLQERLHNDGSASAVHLGFTLAGKRKVRFLQEAVQLTTKVEVTPTIAPDVVLSCEPGHVYLAGVTGARHQVLHQEFGEDCGLLPLEPGLCSVTVMMRSCVFDDTSRRMNTTPNPANVWNTFAACVRDLVCSTQLRMPTLEEWERAPVQ